MAVSAPQPIPAGEDVGLRIRGAIRALIGVRRTSVRQLARDLPMSESSLRDRLSGSTRLSIEETADIAGLLGLTFDELVELSSDERLIDTRWYAENAPEWGVLVNPSPVQRTFDDELRVRNRPLELAR